MTSPSYGRGGDEKIAAREFFHVENDCRRWGRGCASGAALWKSVTERFNVLFRATFLRCSLLKVAAYVPYLRGVAVPTPAFASVLHGLPALLEVDTTMPSRRADI